MKERPNQKAESKNQNPESPQMQIKKWRDLNRSFDKYDYVRKNLMPFRNELEKLYLQEHNQYLLNIYRGKVSCYEKYVCGDRESKGVIGDQDPVLRYYQCYDSVERMVEINYAKLANESKILNYKLDNCLSLCSNRSPTNQQYIQCAQGKKGCFQKYKIKVRNFYSKMYKIILNEQQQKAQPITKEKK